MVFLVVWVPGCLRTLQTSTIQGLSESDADALKKALGIETVRDLAASTSSYVKRKL